MGFGGGGCDDGVGGLFGVCDSLGRGACSEDGDPFFLLCDGWLCLAGGGAADAGGVAVGSVSAFCSGAGLAAVCLHAAGVVDESTDELGLHEHGGGVLFFVQPLAIWRKSHAAESAFAGKIDGNRACFLAAKWGAPAGHGSACKGPVGEVAGMGWFFLASTGEELHAAWSGGLFRGVACGVAIEGCGGADLDLCARNRIRAGGDFATGGGWRADGCGRMVAADAVSHIHESDFRFACRLGFHGRCVVVLRAAAKACLDALRNAGTATLAFVFQLRWLQPARTVVRVGFRA